MTAAAPSDRPSCNTPGCTRPVRSAAAGLCRDCDRRSRRRGRGGIYDAGTGPNARAWKGAAVTYAGAHERTIYLHGPATGYRCTRCTARANEWALLPGALTVAVSPGGLRYSPEPDDYTPLCHTCHRQLDAQARALDAVARAHPDQLLPGTEHLRPALPPRLTRALVAWTRHGAAVEPGPLSPPLFELAEVTA